LAIVNSAAIDMGVPQSGRKYLPVIHQTRD
jgi:hypothetical protein